MPPITINRKYELSVLSLNINRLNSPIKRDKLTDWIHKQDQEFCCMQETHLNNKNKFYLRVKGWKKVFEARYKQEKPS
jgi:exonuclease III